MSMSVQPKVIRQVRTLLQRIYMFDRQDRDEPKIFQKQTFQMPDICNKLELLVDMYNVEEDIIILALYLVDRLTEKAQFFITQLNSYNLLAVAVILSLKLFTDTRYPVKRYVSFFELDFDRFVEIEHQFVELIQFDLYVEEEHYRAYRRRLMTLK